MTYKEQIEIAVIAGACISNFIFSVYHLSSTILHSGTCARGTSYAQVSGSNENTVNICEKYGGDVLTLCWIKTNF